MQEVAIAKLASSGYLRGRTQIAVVKGGAAPKMLADEEHFHEEMFAPDNDIDNDGELDLSQIRAGVEASLARSAPRSPPWRRRWPVPRSPGLTMRARRGRRKRG